jgi:putative endonuclease
MPAEHMKPQAFLFSNALKPFRSIKIFGTIVIPRSASGFQEKLEVRLQKMSGTLTRLTLRALDSFARLLPRKASGPQHLHTGRRGEEAAYFHLRKHGYVIIARNYRSPRSRSELDLVGWDGATLCFIEVKTRTTRKIMPAEFAVDAEKQRDLSHVAREFLRKVKKDAPFRFDIVSVYFEPGLEADIELFRDAFVIA